MFAVNDQALAYREKYPPDNAVFFRVVNGEADGLPGLYAITTCRFITVHVILSF